MKKIIFFLLLLFNSSSFSKSEDSPQKIVSRMYQLTEEMLAYCASIPEIQLSGYRQDVELLWKSYPEFRGLMLSSPHYSLERDRSSKKKYVMNMPSPIAHKDECAYYQRLIKSLIKTPEGKKEMIKMTKILKKY